MDNSIIPPKKSMAQRVVVYPGTSIPNIIVLISVTILYINAKIDIKNPILNELSDILKLSAKDINDGLLVHDVRMVPGPTHTNVIFDVAIPANLFPKRDEIAATLSSKVSDFGTSYFAVINTEMSYTDN